MENRSVGQFRWRTFFQEWEGERKMEAEGGKAKLWMNQAMEIQDKADFEISRIYGNKV